MAIEKKYTVFLVDDHAIFLKGLELTLQGLPWVKKLHACTSGAAALELLDTATPDLVFMDNLMPGMDGSQCTRKMRERIPQLKIICLSTYTDYPRVLAMFDAGATGYLSKSAAVQEITYCVQTVINGSAYFDHETGRHLYSEMGRRLKAGNAEDTVTVRERDIYRLLFDEYSTKEISNELNISSRTIDTHRKKMLQKTNSRNVVGLIKYAVRQGIVSWME